MFFPIRKWLDPFTDWFEKVRPPGSEYLSARR
jgi:hypothetical protein